MGPALESRVIFPSSTAFVLVAVFLYICCLGTGPIDSGGRKLAAKIFQIIGIVGILIATFLFIVILHFLRKGLKKANKSLGGGRSEVRKELTSSLKGLDGAQEQLEALSAMTASVKAGMQSGIGAAERFVAFVKSDVFQVGVPVVLWFLLLVFTIPRALSAGKKKKKKKPTPIPPPSWELEDKTV